MTWLRHFEERSGSSGATIGKTMFHARAALWGRLTHARTKSFCTGTTKSNNGDKIESSVSSYHEAYKQLDKLDFMTAAKMLFTQPPKKKQFGVDFHLVQLFFACMPSLAVYLVAQYARYEIRRMEAEQEEKKKQEGKKRQEEDEKAKELELKEEEEKVKSNPVILEVKTRLGKLEETVNEILAEAKKQSNQGDTQIKSESSSSIEKEHVGKPKSDEPTPGLGQRKSSGSTHITDVSQPDQMGKTQNAQPSKDAKK
ncbi:hypothetical protein Dsin_032207 [Dipteronia sinensis]|uniref:Uncharacterized protein n=1 Tax=Dipteronia sinensis TaxID=43782 RepID=A0AAE0DSV0_9ROSI|nr:hypothetical protein Dsin_032207 [Dipteronia sinensis]